MCARHCVPTRVRAYVSMRALSLSHTHTHSHRSRAMKAMSVTSLTTGSAFVFTSLSDIPAISAFGTFAAVVIAWVYILTISWFPACVVIHEKYVVQAKWPAPGFFASHCCGCMLPICGHQWGLQGVAVTPATNSTNGKWTKCEIYMLYIIHSVLTFP